MNWTQLQFANSSVNGHNEVHLLRTHRALTVLVLLQPVDTKYSKWRWRAWKMNGSCNSGQFSPLQFVRCEQALRSSRIEEVDEGRCSDWRSSWRRRSRSLVVWTRRRVLPHRCLYRRHLGAPAALHTRPTSPPVSVYRTGTPTSTEVLRNSADVTWTPEALPLIPERPAIRESRTNAITSGATCQHLPPAVYNARCILSSDWNSILCSSTPCSKKGDTKPMAVTLSIFNRFSILF